VTAPTPLKTATRFYRLLLIQDALRVTYEPGLWVSIDKIKYDILLQGSPLFEKRKRKIAKFGPLFLSSELNKIVYREILEVTSNDRLTIPPPKTNVWTLVPFLMDTGRARAMNNATFAQDKVKSFQYILICHAHPVKQRTNWKLGDGKCYFCKNPETHEHLFYYCEFAKAVRSIISKEMNMEELGIIPTLFYPLGSDEQGSVQTCRRLKTSHIVIPFYGTRFTTMPLGIFGRPDVRPNSSRKSQAPSKLLLLRSLILDERQLIKFPIFITGIDGGQLDPNLTFWTNRPSSQT